MITNPKTLIDMGFNVATMTAFAVPVGGPAIAAGLAGGQMLFDIFFQIPDRTDPGTIAPNKTDLTNAINELKQFVNDSNFNTLLSQYQASIMTLNDQLDDVWSNVSTGDKIRDRARRGPMYQNAVASAQLDSWRTEIDGYKKAILGSDPDLLNVINWIEGDATHGHRMLGLYALTAGLWVNFCNLNIGFELILAMHDYAAAKDKYDNDLTAFNAAHNVWKLAGKSSGQPEPRAPVAPISPVNDDDFLNGSVFADKGKKYVDRFIAHAEPLIKDLRSGFDTRMRDVKTRLDAIYLMVGHNGNCYHDAVTGYTSTPQKYAQMADAQMQVYKGSVEAPMWDRLTTQYGLENFVGSDIATLEATLAEWKRASAIFAPK